MNSVMNEDTQELYRSGRVDFSFFGGKNIFITGATGIIGYNLIHTFDYVNKFLEKPIVLYALVRDDYKAKKLFGNLKHLHIVNGDVCNSIFLKESIDYIIHGASITSSNAFVHNPVDVIETAVNGTNNILKFAKEKKVNGFVYLSSMEVYGTPNSDELITESYNTNINTMDVRSSYSESKRMCENLCTAYNKQYNIPVFVLRLTQTFGAGVNYSDNRVFAEFARCVIEKRNIVLHTNGMTKRSYLYTMDAVAAILTVIQKGTIGEAYNVANEGTFCSIYDMAELVCKKCANGKIDVDICREDIQNRGYAPEMIMKLSCNKINKLGWYPRYGLEEMFRRLCRYMRETL